MEKSDHRPLLGPSFLLLLLLLSSIVCGGHVCWPMVILVQVSLVIITTFTVTNLSFPTAEFFSQLSFWVMDKWGLIFISKIFLIFMIMAERLLDKALMLFFFFFSLFLFIYFVFSITLKSMQSPSTMIITVAHCPLQLWMYTRGEASKI